ncbi:MAG TPA: alkaline phosphatase PhoX [Candidatus Limnocylindrales bacterium]|nr:alkaline phosphatase PhoX [Candidatus Limnocylindrales bacterium]
MAQIDRRTFLRGAVATAGAAAIGGPFAGFASDALAASSRPSFRGLRPVPDERDGQVRLWLPAGFNYRSFHDTESPVVLDDGTVLPGRHDGMGAFPGPDGNVILIRNHELNNPGPAFGDPANAYDPMGQAGTTTIEVTPRGEVVNAYTSLNGIQMACAGGQMPWGAWIACEETVNGPDVGPDFTGVSNIPLQRPHGFLFEVPVDGVSTAEPITNAGRFSHEAVALDPARGVLYQSEDDFQFASGLFRYRPGENPMDSGRLDNDGRLQMLAVKGQPNANLGAHQRRRATYDVEWVDIDDPAPSFAYTPGETAPTANLDAIRYVAGEGFAQGAAKFSRLEGIAYDNGIVYFTSTQGGGPPEESENDPTGWGNGAGQIWAYDTNSERLRLIYESPGRSTLDFPDNVTTSRRGTLILCEDNIEDNYVRGLTRGGQLFDLALNRLVSSTGEPRFGDEFAGTTFSPDGGTLFVNIQAPRGITYAIWGPWERIGV